ncbi:uncharacterized protein LOC124447988 isoform X4 [Xenia sp. Carnegie-2017]|uniref:uncharacterized protein LOC124447988 isoform X4 n=1 Tax=Xenia sp. Carnegie-2017 TaxID=2897299 RepID=UPI001F048A8C|nr:uncharacterized protein LOC124447988 isoform X4 [Xenia sp. Carnegie-2017]
MVNSLPYNRRLSCVSKAVAGSYLKAVNVATFEYFVMQCRWDYIKQRVDNLSWKDHLTLLVLESIIQAHEKNITAKEVLDKPKCHGIAHLFVSKDYKPKKIRSHLKTQLPQFKTEQANADYAKISFLDVLERVPDFGVMNILVKMFYYQAPSEDKVLPVECEILISPNGVKKRRTYQKDEYGSNYEYSKVEEIICDHKDIVSLDINQSQSGEVSIRIIRKNSSSEVVFVDDSMIKAKSLMTLIDGFYRLLVNPYKTLMKCGSGHNKSYGEVHQQFGIHGPIEQKKVDNLLKAVTTENSNPSGVYMLRQSPKHFDSYILSLIHGNEVKNYEILVDNGKYCLKDGPVFDSMVKLVEFYKTEQIGFPTVLTKHCPVPTEELQFCEWKCIDKSTKHRNLLLKLIQYGRNRNTEVKLVGDVRVIFSDEFCIGKGSNETRVFLGLRKDGYCKAVKRILRDNCIKSAQQEKKILNEFNAKKSKYVVNYSYLDEDTGTEYVYLILDLCEESLESFVKFSTLPDLQKALPEILTQILKGLADLHSGPNPILHRDLKPSNVLRDSQGKFLIADFGISRILKNGLRTYESRANRGTEYWIAPESYCEDEDTVDKGRYKKESDVMNAGMVAYYVATKGKHPFGTKRHILDNMLNGNPVGLDQIKDEALKDLLFWMLNLRPEDRPSANEALKHPFLMSDDEKFDFLCKVGNQQPIKTSDTDSSVVKQLNSKYSNWKSFMDTDVYDFFRTDKVNGKMYKYGPSLTECLRLIRNIGQHWYDGPLPQPEPFYKIGNHKAYFLQTFPNLPVLVHAAIRSNDELKHCSDLKNFFNFNESESSE